MQTELSPPLFPALSPKCAIYNSQSNTINIICDTNLSGINSSINDKNILEEESDGIWILKAALSVAPNAMLTINSTDTKWLKVTDNDGIRPNFIFVSGTAKIDGVKITSWNLTDNDIIKQNTAGSTPRPYIRIIREAGPVDILNSEIAYLGYNSGLKQGLSYYGGDGSTLSNSIFHDMWYAFYSSNIGFVTISNNHFYDNSRYGIDPHTGSHDFKITNNNVYNSRVGAICSHDCYKILFEGNKIHNNEIIGLMFSKNTSDSIARNNDIYAANTGIAISESDNNEIYNNTIEESINGMKIHRGSSNNYVHDNTVIGGTNGLNLRSNDTTSNLFENNSLSGMTYAVRVSSVNANNNLFIGNNIGTIEKYEYYVSHNGSLQIRNQTFTDDKIRGGSGYNTVSIFNSGETGTSRYDTKLSRDTITIHSEG